MKTAAIFALTAAVANGATDATTDWASIVNAVNSDPSSTWTASMPSERDILRALDLAGGYKELPEDYAMPKTKTATPRQTALPDEYDARTEYPKCSSISAIRDQCGCGSCFAFGSVEAFADRICIHLSKDVELSAEDIISCHEDENMSCDGGNPIAVWQDIFASNQEGDGAIQESCYPYSIPVCPCNHHSDNSSLPDCPDGDFMPTPGCNLSKKFDCEDQGVYHSEDPLLIPSSLMEEELVDNGPITVAFTVYDDFLTYSSGVYTKSLTAKALGGHSVKIIGYGVDNGVKYWTVANSWNEEWGDAGFFKIRRGVDECYIESSAVVAGIPTRI